MLNGGRSGNFSSPWIREKKNRLVSLGLICLFTGIIFPHSKAQLVVNNAVTPSQLVNTIIGPGVAATNVTMNCPALASGSFTGGSGTNLGINNGILLTSGSTQWAPGPNVAGGSGTINNGLANDPDLNSIAGTSTFDACILEFDLVAICDTIEINYVFASEEYPEFVGSINDAFGFFISGPGIVGVKNIALVPGTTTPVTINNVSPITNSQYYVANTGNTIGYDGFTTVLLAKSAVVPCSTYHIKLAIADAVDRILDSGVFLEEGGLRCSSSLLTIAASTSADPFSNWSVEGCIDGIFTFNRIGDTTISDTVNFVIAGTATNGVDYNPVNNQVIFPPYITSISFPITAIDDGLNEGIETVQLILTDTVCNMIFYDTATVTIVDPPEADAGPDTSFCTGDSMMIGTPPNPILNWAYAWTPNLAINDTSLPQPTVAPTNLTNNFVTQEYIITVSDSLDCFDMDTVELTIIHEPLSLFALQDTTCSDQPVTVVYTGLSAPGATYNWSFTGSPTVIGSGQGPLTLTWTSPNAGTQSVSLVVTENGCTSGVTTENIMVLNAPNVNILPVAGQCLPGNSFDFTLGGNYDSTASHGWLFFPDAIPPIWNGVNPTGINFLTSGPKTAIVQTIQYGCVSERDTLLFEVYAVPDPIWASLTGPQCLDGNEYIFIATGANGPTASHLWTFENGIPSISNQPSDTVSFTAAGFQTVTLIVAENGCVDTLIDSVEVFPPPVVDAGPDVSFCEGEGGATLVGSVFGGNSPYYFTWWCDSTNTNCGIDSINDSDPNVNPTASTWYYVQVVDFNGCFSNVDSAFATVFPKPIVDAGPDIWLCSDSAPCINVTPNISGSTGPFHYQWTPSFGLNNDTIPNPCVRPDTTTIYTLIVEDLITGCTSAMTTVDTSSSFTANVKPLPVANAGPDKDICFGETVMLQGFGFNAGPGYGFEWSPGSSLSDSTLPNPIASPSFTTEYVLVVWSNQCPSFGDTIKVNVHTNPTADAGPNVETCLGELATLHGVASGDSTATYNYQWWPSIGIVGADSLDSLVASPPSTTMYYLQVESSYDCKSPIDSALVTVLPTPQADAGDPISICQGDTITIDAGYYYTTTGPVPNPNQIWHTWTPNVFMNDSTLQDPDVWPPNTMWYYLATRYSTCETFDSVLVTVFPQVEAGIASDTSVICQFDSVQLYSSGGLGGASYAWSPSSGLSDPSVQNPMASPNTTTTYVVLLEEGKCADTASVTIEVIPRPVAAYLSSQTSGCVPFTVSFLQNSSDAKAWVWDFGDGTPTVNEPNPTHTFEEAGNYLITLTAINDGACDHTISSLWIHVEEQASADFTSVPDYPAELSLPNSRVEFQSRSANAVSWHWDFGDGNSIKMNEKPDHTYQEPGEFMVTLKVTNLEGCVSEIVHGPFVVFAPDLFIPNVFSPNEDNINDLFLVRYTGSQPFFLQIFDRWGTLLHESRNKLDGWRGIDEGGEAVAAGVYFYKLSIGKKDFSGNVTLMR